MNTSLLFDNNEEREATERVLAAFKVKDLNEKIDTLITDVLKYAKEMDDVLEENNLPKRFLDKVSALNEEDSISLDADLTGIDFRVREILEDLIKRVNTRIGLIKENNNNLKYIEQTYNLENIDLEEEIKIARLRQEDFV